MSELEAINWIKSHDDVRLHFVNLIVVMWFDGKRTTGDSIIDCVVKMKKVIGE